MPDHEVVIGRWGSTYGIKGWIKVVSFTDPPEKIFTYTSWTTPGYSITLNETRHQGHYLLAKLVGYDSPETVKVLAGKTIAVSYSQLPALKDNEYYWADLKGLVVINQHGKTLGKVNYLLATGANDVLVVNKNIAIPYLMGTVIKQVDLEQGTLYVDWDDI